MEMSVLHIACILLAFANFGQCCGPAEIGQEYTLFSKARVPDSAEVRWEAQSITVYDSTQDFKNQSIYPNIYVGKKSQLTILDVKIEMNGILFQQIVNYDVVYTCELPIYMRARTPTCVPVALTGNDITTTCTTTQVFPQAKCQFTLQNGEMDRRVILDGSYNITYTHNNPQGRNTYNNTSCALQYPVDGFKPGTWTVQVNMYPDLTGVSLDQGTHGQAVDSLHLTVPTVNIDLNFCPKSLAGEGDTNVRQGYIRQGEQASCLCTRAHAGNPPGTVGWTSTQGGSFDILSHSEENPKIKIKTAGTFTCQSASVLDGSHNMTYTPKFAYGPSNASLIFKPSGPIYLCPGKQQQYVNITCLVPANSFNPAILFTIQDDNSNKLVTKVLGDTAQSKSVNYKFTKSGQHKFTCRAENFVFNDIFREAQGTNMQVYAPPNRPPSFKVTGQFVIIDDSYTWVKQGSDISVYCLVDKAYPLVNSVTVKCDQVQSSSGELSVTDVRDDRLVCNCTAEHATWLSCNGQNLYKEVTIHTAYGPNEVAISFADNRLRELSNEPLNLCGFEGLDLYVICAVQKSEVRPGLINSSFTLIKPDTFTTQKKYLDTSSSKEYKSVSKLKVTSGGSHSLVCEAQNPKFSDIKQNKTLTIEVREPPSDPPKMAAKSNLYGDIVVEGDDVTVTCSVSGGYPAVQSVTLTCGKDQSVTSNGTSAELTINEIGLTYNETNCTCQATHLTGCYDLKSALQLTVLMSNQTISEQEDSPPIGAAVGGAIGAFVVMAVVVGGIYFIRRRMKKKERPYPEEGGYDPHQDPKAVIIDNDLYATARQEQQVPVSAKDYTTIKPTMESATALPKKYNPENVDNPYEDVKPMELDRKSLAKKSQTKPTPGAKPKIPKTSVKTNPVPKPGEQAQNNTDSEYATVAKTKPPNSKSSDHDQTDDLTTAGATGGMPVVPDKLYDKDELKDSVNQQSASKGKQKKTKEKSAKKEKKKDKKEKNKKGSDTENDHIYSNETFDRSGDADVYANIAMGMKSTTDVDDGMHKNKDGLVYTTIVGVGSLKGVQRPVHHPRKETSVDYADIDFNKIVANREDQD